MYDVIMLGLEIWCKELKVAFLQQNLEEPFIQDEPWHLQQGDEDEVDRVGLPQHDSNWNEGRGCTHLGNY